MFSGGLTGLLGSLGTVSILVLLVLLGFSVTSWAIIVHKWRIFKMGDHEEAEFLRAYDLEPKEFEKLQGLARALPSSPSAVVFLGVLERVYPVRDVFGGKPAIDQLHERRIPEPSYLDKVIRYIVQDQISYQESYLPFLATTGNITPFIGLFGTVVGIINAFREIGIQGSASIAAVAPGVAEALVATAAGLFAAIPAVVAYNYFLTRIRKAVFRTEAFSIEFLKTLSEKIQEEREVEAIR